jgi:Tfp pilus assembly protein PilF
VIKSKKFENNDFIEKIYVNNEDALAVIDLAEACNMFNEENPPNYKASGICYCNIGNIQYKNGNFDQAEDNFAKAVIAVKKNLKRIQKDFEKENLDKEKQKKRKEHLSNKQLRK